MTNNYIENFKKKQEKREVIDNYIFGLIFGFSMILIFTFRLLYKKLNIISYIDVLFIIYGLVCVVLATINPKFKLLSYIRKINTKIFNFLGESILKIILIIAYIIFVIPGGMLTRKKEINNTTFVNFKNCYSTSFSKDMSKYKFLRIFSLFSNEYFYMLPLIIILFILSILVVLISSSVFTPLIYSFF